MPLLDAVPRLRRVLPDGEAGMVEAILRGSDAVPSWRIVMMRRSGTLRFYELAERVTGQGQLLWFGLRKRWFAACVEAAIAEGARQLLVLGAGFDALAAWIAERHPDVHCVEVDAPGTADPKRAGLERAGLLRGNHEVCSADLSMRSLADALGATAWRNDARSVVVAEGLLMYLAPADVERLLKAVHDCTGAGSRLACSCVDVHDDGRPMVGALDGLIRLSLRLIGEPMRWGIHPEDVPAFFAAAGHRVIEQPDLAELRRRYLDPLDLGDEPVTAYEHLVLAER